MTDSFAVRMATPSDIPTIAQHRAQMFRDMGELPQSVYQQLVDATTVHLQTAIPIAEYVGWLAAPAGRPDEIVAGAGLQLRRVLPHPRRLENGELSLAVGRQAIVLKVFTEAPWRRRGLAGLLMTHVLDWVRRNNVETLVLHASDQARGLYERLGFIPTNEMRFVGGPRRS